MSASANPLTEHEESNDDVHDADSFRIDSGQPLIPKPFPSFEVENQPDDADACQHHHDDSSILTGFVFESL